MIRRIVRRVAMRHGRLSKLFRQLCCPDNFEHAEWLRRHGGLHKIGKDVSVGWDTVFMDPAYVSIGDNVGISDALFVTHNAAVRIIEGYAGTKLDAVGKIDVKDHCFIGSRVQIMAGVTIGPWAMVAAGAVVTKDVPPNSVHGGNPARFICTMDEYVERQHRKSKEWPWHSIIESRTGGLGFDPTVEPELVRQRVAFFYPASAQGAVATPAHRAASGWKVPPLPTPAWLACIAAAFVTGALLVRSPFFD